MTTDELNAIVQAVMLEMEKAGVDFDFKAETPQPTDLVYVMRGTADKYLGITVKWQNLLDIIVQKATEARDDAISAKDIAIQTLATIQGIESNVSSMKSSVDASEANVASMKASVEASESNVTQMKSEVSEMKTSVEGTKTEVENIKEETAGLIDTKVSYSDALSFTDIINSSDLTNKVASASALKELATMDLLWTNANTGNPFEGQNITLDLSPYKGIYVEIKVNIGADMNMGYLKYNIGDTFLMSGVGTGDVTINENGSKIAFARTVSTSAVGITFGNGFLNFQSDTYTLANQYAIPYKIYGIK